MDSDFSKLHQIVLNIYKDFQKICSEHNLHYFAISGTTLGAVLWNGIIPWDDDMDIAMPVEDYKKFVKICKKSLPAHLAFSEYIWFGGKLHDKNTTYTNINYIHDPSRYNGVFIDIVPLIGLPNDETERKSFIKNLETFQKFGILFDRYQDKEYGLIKLNQWKDSILQAFPFGSTNYLMDFSDPRYVLSSKGFLNPLIMPFEDTTIPVSSNYEEDLSIQYGKYQKYPPKNQRNSIHFEQSILKLNTPYQTIASEYHKLPQWTKQMLTKKNQNEGSYLKSLYYNQDLLEKSNQEKTQALEELDKLSKMQRYHQEHPIKSIFKKMPD